MNESCHCSLFLRSVPSDTAHSFDWLSDWLIDDESRRLLHL